MPVRKYGNSMTAMGTAKSGYIQRKIVKVCEDVKVQYDGTVRDATGKVYQFSYGDNGFDATKTVRVGDKPYFCDVSRLADRLNMCHELSLPEKELEPIVQLAYKELPRPSHSVKTPIKSEKKELLEKIRKLSPSTVVNEKWSTYELQQRLESLAHKKEEEDELELEEELEDEEGDKEDKEEDEELEDEDKKEDEDPEEDPEEEDIFGGAEEDEYDEPDGYEDEPISDYDD